MFEKTSSTKLCFGVTSSNVTHKFSTFHDFLPSTLFQTTKTHPPKKYLKKHLESHCTKEMKAIQVEILKTARCSNINVFKYSPLQADSFYQFVDGILDLKLPSIGGNPLGDVAVIHPRSIDVRIYMYIYTYICCILYIFKGMVMNVRNMNFNLPSESVTFFQVSIC